MNKTKIAFSGIGAVGGYYGGLLAGAYDTSSEVEIFFIARGKNLAVIKEKGLTVKNTFQTVTVRPKLATSNPEEIGPVDYLFCCTKNYDLEENLKQLQPLLKESTIIIPLLNGADVSERIAAIYPDLEVWKGCVYIHSRLKAPGMVEKFTLKDKLTLGSKNTSPQKLDEIKEILRNAHIQVSIPEDIDLEIWKKFFLIATTATITSFFDKSIVEVINKHEDMFIALGYELQLIAEKKNIPLPNNYIKSVIDLQRNLPTNFTTSMHTDFKNNRPTELESITGYVVREGRRLNISVPTFDFMYRGLKEIAYM